MGEQRSGGRKEVPIPQHQAIAVYREAGVLSLLNCRSAKVLLAVSTMLDCRGMAFFNQERMGTWVGLTRPRVCEAVAALQRLGLITTQPYKSTRMLEYWLTIPDLSNRKEAVETVRQWVQISGTPGVPGLRQWLFPEGNTEQTGEHTREQPSAVVLDAQSQVPSEVDDSMIDVRACMLEQMGLDNRAVIDEILRIHDIMHIAAARSLAITKTSKDRRAGLAVRLLRDGDAAEWARDHHLQLRSKLRQRATERLAEALDRISENSDSTLATLLATRAATAETLAGHHEFDDGLLWLNRPPEQEVARRLQIILQRSVASDAPKKPTADSFVRDEELESDILSSDDLFTSQQPGREAACKQTRLEAEQEPRHERSPDQ